MKSILKNGFLLQWFVKPLNLSSLLIFSLLFGCSTSPKKQEGEVVFTELSSEDGYKPQKATALTKDFENTQARFNKTGDTIVFLRKVPLIHEYFQAYTKNLKSGEMNRITVQKAPVENPSLTKSNRTLYFSSPFEEWIEHPKLYDKSRARIDWPQLHPEVRIFEQDIYSMEISGTKIKRLTVRQGFDGHLEIDQRERNGVYSRGWRGHLQLYSLDLRRAKSKRLTGTKSHKLFPKYSPNNKKLAWVEYEPSNDETPPKSSLIVGNSKARRGQVFFESTEKIITPTWHPKGDWILFSSDRGHKGNFELYVVKSDKSCLQRLTYFGGDDLWGDFSPDGSQIVFTSNRTGKYQVYLMNFYPRDTCPEQ